MPSGAWMGLAPRPRNEGGVVAHEGMPTPGAGLDVKEPNIPRVADDERPTRLHVLTHED